MSSATPIWRSQAIRLVHEEAASAARSDVKVLLTGESGVGKEVFARYIHQQSLRRSSPFVVINCAGVPDTLLESELFGHARGSFTGAFRDKPGLFETAHRGTVFLDEVGEMSARMQALLLRFLETGELQRVGSSAAVQRVDVRVIAATNRQLMDRVTEGAFREDLYYRLNVVHICVPPIRERREEIVPLLEHFLGVLAARSGNQPPELADDARSVAEAYGWPGNVREIRNVAERLVVLGRPRITAADLRLFSVLRPATPTKLPATVADIMFDRMLRKGESFWASAYPTFMARDMTRDDVRSLVKRGLQHTDGDYRRLVELFNMKESDYRRFVYFLRHHHCHLTPRTYTESGTSAVVPAQHRPPAKLATA
jgi:transcriptional regulator with PAS, ATPase and Fis domain